MKKESKRRKIKNFRINKNIWLLLIFLLLTIILVVLSGTPSNKHISFTRDLGKNFTIIVLPDTQFYSQDYPEILTNQTRWIVANKDRMNIKFVIQEGDIVNNARDIEQWKRANESFSLLDEQIKYSVVPGNHDHPLDNFNKFFPVLRFQGDDYGYYIDNSNNYMLMDIEGMKFIFLSLDFCPTNDEIAWGNQVLSKYSDRKAVFTTHAFLNENGERKIPNCDTDALFKKLVNYNKNLQIVLCGHMHGEARRTDVNDFGKPVYQILADYQSLENGGNGWLRIMEFSGDRIHVKTYSPYLNQYKSDNQSEFVLDYPEVYK